MTSSKLIERRRSSRQAKFWVGLGASAGGLEALRGLVRNLPPNLSVTYIVAQHMAPHHKSMLSEIIGRETDMRVLDVTDQLVPKANTIYITPPNKNIVVENNVLRLVEPSKEPAAPKPSVDLFFKTLAKEKREFAIGVILSGTGSDGAKGITAIRAVGGITIAQDELTAKYSGMPIAAMETGLVDLVMSPEEIGAQIPKIVKLPRNLDELRASPLNLTGIAELIQLLMDQTKVNFKHYKTATFQRRVERRMAATKTSVLEDYVNIARASSDEVTMLYKDLLISVTSFFRDQVEFDAVRVHIAKIAAEKRGEQIRVWVPGTATGEEAYSLAMLFMEAQSVAVENVKLQVFATDIDANAIEIARRGFYAHTSLEQVPQEFVRKYFDRAPTGYTVKKFLREKMVFSHHNVAQDPPFLNIDMISCRNLLIYFQANLQAEVFSRFHYSLVPNGLLFLGKAEAISASEALFRAASHDKHIFYQRPSHQRQPPRDMLYQRPAYVARVQSTYPASDNREASESKARFESLVAALGPNALLINSAMQVERAYGDVSRYVTISAGSVDTRISTLVREPYRGDIQSSAPSVIRNKKAHQGMARTATAGGGNRERITIYPLKTGKDEDVSALVVFSEWQEDTKYDTLLESGPASSLLNRQIDELSNELAIAKTNLQQTVEELEASNEELQALNEELQSSNEELQSTNEELETSNEELQSTNEELSTVNEELQVNAQQLNMVNQSLSSILDNIAVPMLVVDRSLIITHASKGSEKFFGISADVNMPHVSRCRLRPGYPDLMSVLTEAMTSGKRQDFYIDKADESAIMKVVPHFTSLGDMVGAIVLVSDNTDELLRARKELQLIFDNVPAAIMVRGANGKIVKANIAAHDLFGVSDDSIVGTSYFDYFDHETARDTETMDKRVFESGNPLTNVIRRIKYKKGGSEIWVRESLIPAKQSENGDSLTYVMKQNITEQYLAEMSLKESQLRLDQAVKASRIGLWEWDIKADRSFLSDRFKEIVQIRDNAFSFTITDFTARVHPEDRYNVDEACRRHFEERVPYEAVYRIRRDDRQFIWVRSFGQATWDDRGVPLRFTGTIEDITEQRENLLALRERREQLELAASLAGVGQWKLDVVNDTVYWSQQSYVIHGVNAKDYVPNTGSLIDFYHPDDQPTVRTQITEAVEKGRRVEFEARIIRGDRVVRIVRSIGLPNIDERGEVVSVLGSFQDVTESREREAKMIATVHELARSNEELNRFSYVCSHDMKEPVRMIESMAALLTNRDFDANEKVRAELLSRISVNTRRLRAIIDGLLAYSRIEAKIEVTKVDLNIILAEICDGLSQVVSDQGAKIEVGPLPVVSGATVHFTQLFHNLIGNALKYSDKAVPLVRLSARDTGSGWLFLLEDNGPGVPEGSRLEIFKLFSRLKRRDEVEGTGLGLSIAQRIVEQYSGTIKCLSSVLGGAAFEIILPHAS